MNPIMVLEKDYHGAMLEVAWNRIFRA